MGKLKRKHARLCILLLAMAFVFVVWPVVMYKIARADLAVWGVLGIGGAVICTALITALRFYCLRCPSCGRGMAMPQWNAGKRYHCPCCGEPFVYDDEV